MVRTRRESLGRTDLLPRSEVIVLSEPQTDPEDAVEIVNLLENWRDLAIGVEEEDRPDNRYSPARLRR
jgi:hypothetical protein